MLVTRLISFVCLVTLSLNSANAETLVDIYQLALTNDPQLKAAQATFNANKELMPQARSALLPSVNAQGSTSWEAKRNVGDGFRRFNTHGYSVRLTQPIFRLDSWFSFKQSLALTDQARAQLAKQQQDLMIRVANAYFNVLRVEDNIAAAKAEEDAIQRQLEQTQQRFEVGLLAITDVHEAQAAYDLSRVKRITQEGNLDLAFEALEVLTGQRHTNLAKLGESFPIVQPQPSNAQAWTDLSLINNFDVQIAVFGLKAANQNKWAKRSGHLPTIEANWSFNHNVSNEDQGAAFAESCAATNNASPICNLPDILAALNQLNGGGAPPTTSAQSGGSATKFESTSLGLTINLPLFAGGAISSSRRQAYSQEMAAQYQVQLAQRNTIKDTRNAVRELKTDVLRIEARQASITSTKSALKATEIGYEVGTRNVVDVLQSQRALYGAQADLANARYDFVLNQLRLKEVAGQLSPEDFYALEQYLEGKAVLKSAQ